MNHQRSNSPGVLGMWSATNGGPARLKEVVAVIRPERWAETKARLQRLHLPAFTQQRVLGRGRERGLRYLPRQGAAAVGVRYLPKRMVSWMVEESKVEQLVQALIEVNQTGQVGDGKIFVLPLDEALRIRTGDRGREALQPEHPYESVQGDVPTTAVEPEALHATRG